MHVRQRGAHGDGVEPGQGLGEQAALEAGVDRLDLELGAEQLTIALLENLAHVRVLGVAPAGVLVVERDVEAQGVGERLDALLDLLLERRDGRARREQDRQALILGDDDAQVGGDLHETVGSDVAAQHAVGREADDADERPGVLGAHRVESDAVGDLDRAGKRGVEDLELAGDVGRDGAGDVGRTLGVGGVGKGEHRRALARDGVVLGAAVEAHEARRGPAQHLLDDAGHEEVRVAALQVDVGAGVASQKAGDLDGERAALDVLALEGAREGRHHAAGAAHGRHALLLGVQVDHGASGDLGLVEGLGAHQTRLLVGGEHALERGVHERVVIQHRHHESDGDAVVGAERGAVGGQDAVLDDELDAVMLEIVLDAGKLVADHVDMALHHDGRGTFGTGARGLLDDDVVDVVLVDIEPALLGEGDQKVADTLLVTRTARNGADVLEKAEEGLGLVSGNDVCHVYLSDRRWLGLQRDTPAASRQSRCVTLSSQK